MAHVVVTGAAGRIGSRLLPGLEGHAVTAIDRDPIPDPELDAFESIELDITEDTDRLRGAFDGSDTVIHLAARPMSDETWERVLSPNVNGTYQVYAAAVDAGVGRVVFASSNHTVHMHNVDDPANPNSMCEDPRAITTDDPTAPSGPYGISKIAGEAIGSYFAARHGIEVVNFRIGSFLPRERLLETQEDSERVARYHRAMYLSPRDGRHAFRRAIEADLPENPITVNVTSRNTERYLSITHTMRSLGYRPRDDSTEVLSGASGSTTND